jgi:hypothetical protein
LCALSLRGDCAYIGPTGFETRSRRGWGHVHYRKNFRMDPSNQSRDHQSSAEAAEQTSRKPARTRRDSAQYRFWRLHGLSVRAATAVTAVDCKSLDEIRGLGWCFFHGRKNCGTGTLQELSDLIGGWPDAPRTYSKWIRRAPDDLLIEELHRRGIPAGRGDAS